MKTLNLKLLSVSLVSLISIQSPIIGGEVPQSASVLEFGGNDTLFVADSVGAKIFAYKLPMGDFGAPPPKPYNLLDIESEIRKTIGKEQAKLLINDLAVHPISKEAFLSLTITESGSSSAAIVRIDQEGKAAAVDLASASPTTLDLGKPADAEVTFWRDIPAESLTVTDLDYADGKLYISGLSSGEFASTLRVASYPFSDALSTSSVEIFHTAHGQNETRAPIRAMALVNLNDQPTVVAAYTCTPLALIPTSELSNGAHVTGKTIAELGFGNTPLEVLSFAAYNMQRQKEEFVLVLNKNMGARLFALPTLEAAAKAEGIVGEVADLGTSIGVESKTIPLSGVIQAADQDAQFFLAVRRELETGNLELVSFRKGSYMRISDFISEYNFPDYQYGETPMDNMLKQFQNTLKGDEGFKERMR